MRRRGTMSPRSLNLSCSSTSDLMQAGEYTPPPSGVMQQRQNELPALELLIAQRRLYRRAKRWQSIRWFGVLGIGVAVPFVALLAPQFAVTAGAIAGVWLFIGRTALAALEQRTMIHAACVQEQFDHLVFGMPTTIRRSEQLSPEEVASIVGPSDRVQATANKEQLIDWYPIDIAAEPARVVSVAQRANAAYTDRLIRLTVTVWVTLTALWFIVLISWAIWSGVSFASFLLGAFFPVLPAVLDAASYVLSTWRAARDRSDLSSTIEERLLDLRTPIEPHELLVWQERLFDLRRTTPQVPDLLYKLVRPGYERAMHRAAEQLQPKGPQNR